MSSSPRAQQADVPRRASGRVRKQTDAYTPDASTAIKRKRSALDNEDGDVNMPDEVESDEDVPSEDDEADEEEIREQQKRSRKSATQKRPPAQKKAKLNGAALPIRSAGTQKAVKRAPRKQKVPNTLDMADADGLFAKVFGSGDSLQDIAGQWIQDFQSHESRALADVINFVLQCAGCNIKVVAEDIEDPDSVSSRLKDIQDEFLASQPTEYPLIAKGKAASTFKANMTGFLKALIKSIAATNLLYDNTALIENIEEWFSVMSSAADRAFRHTSTVASLSVISALCEIGQENAQETSARQRQAESERDKARPNKSRVKDMEQRAADSGKIVEFIEIQVRDWFTVLFVHRYRDVDPNIRRDCMAAFGEWVITLPEVFFDSKHLRYSGWLLCDLSPTTRAEVLRQLQNLYKERSMIGGLKTFTERFRERLVEMTTSDAESNVRCLGVELLALLRENGLLEPDDIDAVGRLLYDTDPKVRKAVAGFFAENVLDLYNSKIDDLGGLEALEEGLPEVSEDSFESPRLSWLMYKCLAEMMVAYDPDDSSSTQTAGNSLTVQPGADSRFTLAADALYDHISGIEDWQSISGYLLFDHSSRRASGRADSALAQLKQECSLSETEEGVLLHVANASVRRMMAEFTERIGAPTKFTKRQKDELKDQQEQAAQQLASLIPKLLRKFGESPVAASVILKLEAVLNTSSIRDLPRDSKSFTALLDNIRKLFMSHSTDDVLFLARDAILEARSSGELNDVAEEKLAALWEDVVSNLAEIANPDSVAVRAASSTEDLQALNSTLLRVVLLSQKSNCVSFLEDESIFSSNANDQYQAAIDYLLGFIQRGMPSTGPAPDAADAAIEDQIASRAAEAAFLYMQWKFIQIKTTITSSTEPDVPFAELEALATRRDAFFNNMVAVLRGRRAGDSICITLAKLILELSTSAKTLSNIRTKPGVSRDYEALVVDLPEQTPKLIMAVFSAAERHLSKLSGKKIESAPSEEEEAEVDINADPIDDDDEDDEDGDDAGLDADIHGGDAIQRKEARLLQTLLAERSLCELTRSIIFAVHGGFLEVTRVRRRLERNKSRLGPNFKELLAYLDIDRVAKTVAGKGAKGKAKAAGAAKTNGSSKTAKGRPHPKSNAIVAEDEEDDPIEEESDDGEDDAEALKRRGLADDEDENEDGLGGAADADEQSVLGD